MKTEAVSRQRFEEREAVYGWDAVDRCGTVSRQRFEEREAVLPGVTTILGVLPSVANDSKSVRRHRARRDEINAVARQSPTIRRACGGNAIGATERAAFPVSRQRFEEREAVARPAPTAFADRPSVANDSKSVRRL